jgi:hypothetical protein
MSLHPYIGIQRAVRLPDMQSSTSHRTCFNSHWGNAIVPIRRSPGHGVGRGFGFRWGEPGDGEGNPSPRDIPPESLPRLGILPQGQVQA